jgi:crotonobetainyl-CoA:carnitine CoA-transferase CaiB-like acyl-CoA transferase
MHGDQDEMPAPPWTEASAGAPAGPLAGIRVLELGQILAGPLAASILAWYGAEVIKVEAPGDGDPVRTWRVVEDGTSLWWRSLSRGKRLVAIDLRQRQGQDLVRRLVGDCDVLVENFRPGTLEGWGLDPAALRREHPALVVARISGYGQTGPYRERRGFASVCEAFGGLRHITGHPGEVPVRSNASLGDSLAAFQTVIGILLSLLRRERHPARRGDEVDVAIYEAVLGVMEASLTECDRASVVRGPSGTTITGVVPTDAYPTADGRHIVIGANADPVYRRLMTEAGRPDLATDPRLATNAGRVVHQAEVDAAIAAWTRTLPAVDLVARLDAVGVPAGPIQTSQDLLDDPHVQARGLLETVELDGRPLRLPALGPRLVEAPGRTTWPGGDLGADTDAVLRERLALDDAALDALHAAGTISGPR